MRSPRGFHGILAVLSFVCAQSLSTFHSSRAVAHNIDVAEVSCVDNSNPFSKVMGLSTTCTCEGKEFGPGKTGDFAHDEVHASGFKLSGKSALPSFWDYSAFQYGKEISLKKYRSKVALVVNVASAWGYSNAFYASAAELLKKYQAKGLQLIAVPVNEFGEQAPHSSKCERAILYHKMGVEHEAFPVLDKVEANGMQAAPFYSFLKEQKPEAEGGILALLKKPTNPADLPWNYEKFLVDGDGKVVARFTHQVDVKDLDAKINELLSKP